VTAPSAELEDAVWLSEGWEGQRGQQAPRGQWGLGRQNVTLSLCVSFPGGWKLTRNLSSTSCIPKFWRSEVQTRSRWLT
jgi:hypothetical protein